MKQLGKYELLELLGSGATADVYQARDTVLGRDVAIKVLKPALVPDTSAFARFMQEAQAAAKLFHNNIATVLDMGEADGRYFIAMRLISGHSLDKILEEGSLNWNDALRMVKQIGDALDYAHTEGFLHRDVKPSNIIRDDKGDFWLTDFGLTRAMMSTGLTSHTGAVLGTPPYIAPEIWNGEDASPASDQYALACVLYETLTGDVLFKGNTPVAVLTKHTKGAQLPEIWPEGVPAIIDPGLALALAPNSRERFKNLSEFSMSLGEQEIKSIPSIVRNAKNAPLEEKITTSTPTALKKVHQGIDEPREQYFPEKKASGKKPSKNIFTSPIFWGVIAVIAITALVTVLILNSGSSSPTYQPQSQPTSVPLPPPSISQPTSQPKPTSIPEPTSPPKPASNPDPYFTAGQNMFCREGPGTQYEDKWQLESNQTVPIVAKWSNNWLLVGIDDSRTRTTCCWVGGEGFLTVSYGSIPTISFLPDRMSCDGLR